MEMSVEQWWKDTGGKTKVLGEKPVSHCHIFHHKCHTGWSMTEHDLLQ
jgi:hypothetical protein